MGFFSKLFKGPEIDMEKSNANSKKMRALFNQVVENGDNYRLIFGYTEDVSRFNYGFVHGSKTKIGNLIVGWNETSQTIVVVQHSLYDQGTTIPEVRAITFRMDTGEVMPPEEMTTVDEELVRQFRARDSYQNGSVDFVENASDEELLQCLSDPDTRVMFYTPVGLEIGFNYDGGWVTVTIKDTIL